MQFEREYDGSPPALANRYMFTFNTEEAVLVAGALYTATGGSLVWDALPSELQEEAIRLKERGDS